MFKKETLSKLTVVIPSKNGLHHLKECLPTVVTAATRSSVPVQIVVVDDNSTDGTMQQAPELFPGVVFLPNPGKGACSARNNGVKKSPSDWICFLDNDVFVEPDFFNIALPYLQPDIFCVTCTGYAAYPKQAGSLEALDGAKLIYWKRGFPRFTSNYFPAINNFPKETYPSWGVQGAYFFCQTRYFNELQGFDTMLEPYLLEETDLAYRGLKRGWKIILAPNTKCRHKCGGTIASKTNRTTQFLSRRNRIIFVWKNIQDKRLLLSSLAWSVLRCEFKALWYFWKIRESIFAKRAYEDEHAVCTDREILDASREYYQ